MEHKHAAVLRAIADGKAVQYFRGGSWHDMDTCDFTPIYTPGYEWRIKDVVRYVIAHEQMGWETRQGAEKNCGNMKIVIFNFDGETGKLKSAEVLP